MKKILLTAILGLYTLSGFAQTTATNFTVNDCAGVTHDLFTELDSGKVIVLNWIMPCSNCIAPSLSAYNTVQGFATTNPGRVFFYLADDKGDTPCSTINTWADNYNMPNAIRFSNAAIKMEDYGAPGMPKVVILGGKTHTIFYNAENTYNTTAMKTAINDALNATSVMEQKNILSSVDIHPNPAKMSTTISYSILMQGQIQIELFNLIGKKIYELPATTQNSGIHSLPIDTQKLTNGIYFIKISSGNYAETTLKLSVAH